MPFSQEVRSAAAAETAAFDDALSTAPFPYKPPPRSSSTGHRYGRRAGTAGGSGSGSATVGGAGLSLGQFVSWCSATLLPRRWNELRLAKEKAARRAGDADRSGAGQAGGVAASKADAAKKAAASAAASVRATAATTATTAAAAGAAAGAAAASAAAAEAARARRLVASRAGSELLAWPADHPTDKDAFAPALNALLSPSDRATLLILRTLKTRAEVCCAAIGSATYPVIQFTHWAMFSSASADV